MVIKESNQWTKKANDNNLNQITGQEIKWQETNKKKDYLYLITDSLF